MSDLTKEFERIIEDTSGGLHNSQWWWDEDFADDGVTIIDGLCSRLESAAMKFPPTLPRVSPEDLVEGEVYYAKPTNEAPFLVGYVGGQSTGMHCYRGWFVQMGEDGTCCHPTSTTYYGPLKFTIGGAE